MVVTPEGLIAAHHARYVSRPGGVKLYRAPGRVNLIGEHTDYSGGFVLPIALQLHCTVTRSSNNSGELRAWAANQEQERRWPASAIPYLQPAGDWGDYVAGVAVELSRAGFPVEPSNLRIESTVPMGAGLSSSAAIEAAVALALLDGRPMARTEIAALCRRAENNFAGIPCGIMDQFVSLLAAEGSALLIDCDSLESRPVKLPDQLAIIVVNSMVKHELGQSAYAERVAECSEAARRITVPSLRQATADQLEALDGVWLKRARHVITENQRVLDFLSAAESNDLAVLGRLMRQSHESLRDDFAVSCRELDLLADLAGNQPGVYGARMTGGGFGGCTVNLLQPEMAGQFKHSVQTLYRAEVGIDPEIYECIPSAGANRFI